MTTPTIHASAMLFGHRGILIRGPSGSGKSALTLALLQANDDGFARLVGDDRIHVEAAHGRLLMRPAARLRGLIEVRGLGIVRMDFEPEAVADLVVDLTAEDGARLPEKAATVADILGIRVARLPVAPGSRPVPLVLALLRSGAAI